MCGKTETNGGISIQLRYFAINANHNRTSAVYSYMNRAEIMLQITKACSFREHTKLG